jgi:hypothetical protein
MTRFLLGCLVGALVTAACMPRRPRTLAHEGRVDELSTAAAADVPDPELNAGDGTPSRQASSAV